jgi:dTDP-4-dehydrorhamnose reductase
MRIFITGVQGLIGWNAYRRLKDDHDVCGFSKTKRHGLGEWYDGLLEDYKRVSEILEKHEPEIIVHTQAMCNLDLCELKPDKTHLINVEATEKLLDALDPKKHRLVYMSSDHVFSGNKGNYTEDDALDPVSVYGRTRKAAEELIQKRFPDALIIRPGLVIGRSLQGNIGPFDFLRSRVVKNQTASYFVDEFRSPIEAQDLIAGMMHLIGCHAKGIYHLAGDERISRYDLAKRLIGRFVETVDHKGQAIEPDIKPKYRKDDREAPRIADCSLNSSKARQLGWSPSFVRPVPLGTCPV